MLILNGILIGWNGEQADTPLPCLAWGRGALGSCAGVALVVSVSSGVMIHLPVSLAAAVGMKGAHGECELCR